jgi:hypothetical protein
MNIVSDSNSGQHVTIQVGHSSNFIAQHLWNIRAANSKSSSLPRTVVVDLAHSFGRLSLESGTVSTAAHLHNDASKRQSTKAEANNNDIGWAGATQLIDRVANDVFSDTDDPPVLEFARRRGAAVLPADETIDTPFWSDFALQPYRIGSLHALHEHQMANLHEFGGFATGERVWARHAEADELDDRLRVLLESCDRVDAVTAFADVDDSFGGVAAIYLARLRDEVPKVTLTAFALQNRASDRAPVAPVIAGVRLLSLNAVQQHASLFTLVSPLAAQCAFAPSSANNFRTAALLALPIEAFLSEDATKVASMLTRGSSRNLFAMRSYAPLAGAEQTLTPLYGRAWTYGSYSPVYSVSFAEAALPAEIVARAATLQTRFDKPLALPRSFPAHGGARIASTSIRVEAGAPQFLDGTLAALLADAGRADRTRRRLCAHANGVEEDDIASAIADIENWFDLSNVQSKNNNNDDED